MVYIPSCSPIIGSKLKAVANEEVEKEVINAIETFPEINPMEGVNYLISEEERADLFDGDEPRTIQTKGLDPITLPASKDYEKQFTTNLFLLLKNGEQMEIKVLCDSGSELTLMSKRLFERVQKKMKDAIVSEKPMQWRSPSSGQMNDCIAEVTPFFRFKPTGELEVPIPMFVCALETDYEVILGLPHFVSFGIQSKFTQKEVIISFPFFGIQHCIDRKTRQVSFKSFGEQVKESQVVCANCGTRDFLERNWDTCKLCNAKFYCSSGCKNVHWNTIHKLECTGAEGWRNLTKKTRTRDGISPLEGVSSVETIRQVNGNHLKQQLLGESSRLFGLANYQPGYMSNSHQVAAIGLSEESLDPTIPSYGVKGGHASQASITGPTVHPTREQFSTKLKKSKLVGWQKEVVLEKLWEFKEAFYISGAIPIVKGVVYDIDYNGPDVSCKPFRFSPENTDILNKMIEEQIDSGFLIAVSDPSELKVVSNVFLKQETAKWRMLINYVEVNKGIAKTNYPIDSPEQKLAWLSGGYSYSSFDGKSGYSQMAVTPKTSKLLTFCYLDRKGQVRFARPTRLTMGSINAVPSYSFWSQTSFGELRNCSIYLDDLSLKHSGNWLEDLKDLLALLRKALEVKMIFNFDKVELFQQEMKVLGEIIDASGRRPNPERLGGLMNFELPKTQKQLMSFLGLYNFIAKSIPRSSNQHSQYLHSLTKSGSNRLAMTERYVQAVEALKRKASAWILLSPFDPGAGVVIQSDSSGFGAGILLLQFDAKVGCHRVVFMMSKAWPPEAKRYPAHELEASALILGVKRYDAMIRNCPSIELQTDSVAAANLLSRTDFDSLNPKMMRWRVYLSSFVNSILTVHYVGQRNVVACDVMGRQQRFLHQQSSELLRVVGAVKSMEDQELDWTDATYVSPFLQRLFEAQRKDAATKVMIEDLKKGARPLQSEFYLNSADYKGLLCRRAIIEGQVVHQLVVPRLLMEDVLAIAHDSLADGGHRGVTKTIARILERFWWKDMRHDVEEYIKICRSCQLAKAQQKPFQKPYKTRIVTNLFQVISVDVLEISVASYGFNHILVIIDDFSRFSLLVPTKTQSAMEMAAIIYERVVCLYGPPLFLLSDNHGSFIGQTMVQLRKLVGSEAIFTKSRSPTGNAINERSHRSIMVMIRIYCESKAQEWIKYLPSMQYVINTTALKGFKSISPYDIVFGRRPRLMNTGILLSPALLAAAPKVLTQEDAIEIAQEARNI